MLCFLVTVADRLVAGVGISSNWPGLMEFAFGRASDTWDVPVLSAVTRNTTTQYLFQAETTILKKYRNIWKKKKNNLVKKKRKEK